VAKQVGVGIIGCGRISEFHALGFLAIPEKARIVATSDVVVQLAEDKAKQWGTQSYYSDYRKLLQRDDVDAVDILLPHHLHAEVAVSAAEAGKHVLCEKPIATTLEDADRIISAAKRHDIKLMIGHNYRFKANYMKMKEIIDEGTIGTVYSATAEGLGFRVALPADSWRYSLSKAGGGIFMSQGIHYCDLFRWLIGEEVKEVYGIAENFVNKTWEVEDNMLTLVRFKNGALGDIFCTNTEKKPYWDERVKIRGTKGTAVADWATGKLVLYSDEIPERLKGWASFSFGDPWKPSIAREVEHFVDCIIGDKEPFITGEDGKAALKIVLAAYQSAKTHKWIEIS